MMKHIDVESMLPTDFNADKYLLVKELSRGDHAVFFYQDHEGYTHFFNGRKDQVINREVVDKYKALGAVPLAMNYGYDGKVLYFSQPMKWSEKKQIIVKLDTDGKVLLTKEMSDLSQVLRPASFAFDGSGNAVMTWIDESPPRVRGVYSILAADGSTSKEVEVFDETAAVLYIEPIHTPKGFAVVYSRSQLKEQGPSEVRVKRLPSGEDSVVYSAVDLSGFDLARVDDSYALRPFVPGETSTALVLNRNFEQTGSAVLMHPKEIGASFGFTDALTLTSMGPVAVGSGVHPKGVPMEGLSLPQKPALYIATAGEVVERVAGGRPHMFTSEMPTVLAMSDSVVVGYSDLRFINTVPMLAVMNKNGALVKRDIVLESPSVVTGRVQLVQVDSNTVRAFYPVRASTKANWIYRFRDLNIQSMEGDYALPSDAEREKSMLARARKYAECRMKEDYQCIYDMLDPKYRSVVSKSEHESRMRSLGVTLMSYTVEQCEVMEASSLGRCRGEIAAKLPASMMGRPIPENQREVKQPMTGEIWVFVDGQWYYAISVPMLGYVIRW